MDDDDSYLYGESTAEEVVKPTVETSGESLVIGKRGCLSPHTFLVLLISAMEILMILLRLA